jgi:hypothetical protein
VGVADWRSLSIVPWLVVASVACAPVRPPESGAANLLVNGSFEAGRSPWFDFQRPDKPYWGTFELSDSRAIDGRYSVRLALDSHDFPGRIGIAGAAQDVRTAELPHRLAGHYRVDQWERGTRAQYVQVVVMAMGASNLPQLGGLAAQLSFVLAGSDVPPIQVANRLFEIVGPLEPELGRWIPFDFDLHEAYERRFGARPEGISNVRVFVEARFDDFDRRNDQRARALVYFDALGLEARGD